MREMAQNILPEPKFSIGDEVWCSHIISSEEDQQCPDCLGSREWEVISPAGQKSKVNCPRCNGKGNIGLRCFKASADRLTIGMISGTTHPYSSDDPVSYMCDQTGIGSGTVYRENRLFSSEKDALANAKIDAFKKNEALDKNQPERNFLRSLSAYQLRDAEIEEAQKKGRAAWYKYERLLDHICELDEFPSAGEPYKTSCSLTKEQVAAVQESLVWLDETAVKILDEWRRAEP